VFRVTPSDSVALPGRIVALHRIRAELGEQVDSVSTDGAGRYGFRISAPDTSDGYFVGVEHDGIGYFSAVLRVTPRGIDTVPPIVVYDTSYTQPDIFLQDRHVIVRSAGPDGTRQVIELLALANRGRFTRIAGDTSTPVWHGALPPGAFQLEVGQSEVGARAVYRRGDSIAVAAPIPPGEKQILISYLVPGSMAYLALPVDQPIVRMSVLLEDTTATISSGQMELRGMEEVGDAWFNRYEAAAVPPSTLVAVRFETPSVSPGAIVKWLVVGVAALALAASLWRWTRSHRAAKPHIADSQALAAQIAALDVAFESRRGEISDDETAAYRARRAELKARLSEALAAARRTS